jgi:hypothetical protein
MEGSSRHLRGPSPVTYQQIRREQGEPPQSELNPSREVSEYVQGFNDDQPQCPLIVHQADDIHNQAKKYFKHTRSEMPLSAEQKRIVRRAPEAKEKYYKDVGSHLVSVGLMAARDSSSEEVFGSGSEEAMEEAQRRRRHYGKRHEGSRRRTEW